MAPEHTAFRKINDKYYTPERMQAFEPLCRAVIKQLVAEQPTQQAVEIMQNFAKAYAVRIQNAFMGWPESLEQPLNDWIDKNRIATLKQDSEQMAQIALEFDGYIRDLFNARRVQPTDDVTNELLNDIVGLPSGARTMTEEELLSLIRNWTVGELSTISASAGIVIKFLAENQAEQQCLRQNPSEIPAALEEMMRLNDPLVTNRRRTRCPVHLNGVDIAEGEQVTVNWVSANRDEAVFENALEYNPHRDQSKNLVHGAGIHQCSSAPLARLELRLLLEELLARFSAIKPEPSKIPFFQNAIYPVLGYSELFVRFE